MVLQGLLRHNRALWWDKVTSQRLLVRSFERPNPRWITSRGPYCQAWSGQTPPSQTLMIQSLSADNVGEGVVEDCCGDARWTIAGLDVPLRILVTQMEKQIEP